MLTLLSGQAEIVFACRTLSINVGFLVTVFAFLKLEKILRLINNFDKF